MLESLGDAARALALYHEARALLDVLSTNEPRAHWQDDITQLDARICAIS
jgi:hypothetical protein